MKLKDILQAHKVLPTAAGQCRQDRVSSAFCIAPRMVILTILGAASCLAQVDGGGGPSILSRGGARPGQSGGKPVSFNFYAGLNGSYSTGSIPIDTGSTTVEDFNLVGASVNAGLTGSHAWKRSSIGVDYRGSYRRYGGGHSYANGTEQALDLQYTIQTGRRIIFTLSQIGGISNFANGGFITPTSILDPSLIGVPTNNIFDNRVYYLQSSVGMTYRQSSRLAFSFTGDGFSVHRASSSLVGMNGSRAGAQMTYQLTRRDQIGISYSFMHFSFPRAFGASDLHGVAANYSRKLAPGLQFTLSGGAYRVESLGAEQVTLSPEIAAILGQTTGFKAVYSITYIPQVSAGINYAHGKSTFNASLAAGATPGNGVYLTSKSESAGFGYSYSGIRKLSLSAAGGVSQFSSVFQTLSTYRSYYAAGTASYNVARHLSASFQSDLRTFTINGQNRFAQTVSIGLYWSPTEIPIPSW
jgi:hypothetical protein